MLLEMSKSDQRCLCWEHTEAVKLTLTLEIPGGKPGHEEDRMRSNDADWQQVDGLSQGHWVLNSLNLVTGV